MGIQDFDNTLPKFLLGGSVGGCMAVKMALQEVSTRQSMLIVSSSR